MSRQQRAILITLLLGVFMGALDIFIVAPALDAIQGGLHVAPRVITWSFTAYTLILVVTQPFVAKLSDRLGRRWVYVTCVILFGVGSLLCAQATSFAPFIVGRSIQAVGAGGVLPVASAVIADVFPEERRGMALGFVGSVFGLAFIIGPIIGSVLTSGIHLGAHLTDWHSIFYVNVPLVVIIVLLAARVLPTEAPGLRVGIPFDWNGAFLLALALFCIIFGLTQLDFTSFAANITNEAALPMLVLGLALLVPFWLNEQRAPDPLVDTRAFGRKQLIIAILLSIGAGIITSSIVYVPQLIEATFGLAKGAGGFYLVWVALTLTIGTPLTGRLLDRLGARQVMLIGSLVSSAAFGLLLIAGGSTFGLIVALLLIGYGLATYAGTPLRYIVINEAPVQRRATSLAVLTVCNSLGQTIVLPLGGALISSALIGVAHGSATATRTANAIHGYYAIVLGILLVAALLTTQLKSRTQELADRQVRQRQVGHTVTLPSTHQNAGVDRKVATADATSDYAVSPH